MSAADAFDIIRGLAGQRFEADVVDSFEATMEESLAS